MDYHITLKRYVDKLFINCPSVDDPIEFRPAENYEEDYEEGYAGPFVYNGVIPQAVFDLHGPEIGVVASLLCYGGAGGFSEYTLKELLSVPLEDLFTQASVTSPFLINSPSEVRYILVEIPADLMELLNMPRYIHVVQLNRTELKKQNKWTDADLTARGVDPTLKNWIGHAVMHPMSEVVELIRIITKCRPVSIHCYSFTGEQRHKIKKHEIKEANKTRIMK